MFNSMRTTCNVDIRRCGAANPPPRIATRLANMKLSWLTSNATVMRLFREGFVR